jgi:hypothetical protein
MTLTLFELCLGVAMAPRINSAREFPLEDSLETTKSSTTRMPTVAGGPAEAYLTSTPPRPPTVKFGSG